METTELTLAERGQIVIPKAARDALGLKPGARLQLKIEGGRLLIEKRVQLDLSRWIGKAVDDGLSSEQALSELRGRPVPWVGARASKASGSVAMSVRAKGTAVAEAKAGKTKAGGAKAAKVKARARA